MKRDKVKGECCIEILLKVQFSKIRICLIRCRGYYLFHHAILCSFYLRAAFIKLGVIGKIFRKCKGLEKSQFHKINKELRCSDLPFWSKASSFIQHVRRCGNNSRTVTNRERHLIDRYIVTNISDLPQLQFNYIHPSLAYVYLLLYHKETLWESWLSYIDCCVYVSVIIDIRAFADLWTVWTLDELHIRFPSSFAVEEAANEACRDAGFQG